MKKEKQMPISAQEAALLLAKRFNHPKINEVLTELEIQSNLGSQSIVMVVGPAGVGKTTLSRTIENRLLSKYYDEMQAKPGMVPVCRVEAKATSEKEFNWKLFYLDLLEKLDEKVTTAAVSYEVNPLTNRVVRPLGRSRDTAANLRRKVEKAIQARGLKYLIIDEGGHFTNVSQARMKSQTDALKSLANCAGCQIILLGSYDILDFSRLSAQLARRIREIHFCRYKIDSVDDSLDFLKILHCLEELTKGFFQGVLVESYELLLANTLGCVGSLMKILETFVARVASGSSVTFETLKKDLYTPRKVCEMLEDIRRGEERFSYEGASDISFQGAA